MENAISVRQVSITLSGNVEAIKNITIDLPAGKTIGIIGPSGAGKTTLIRGIVGRLNFKEGTITVLGQKAGSAALRKQIGYMTQELSVYPDLTVEQNLVYFAKMTDVPKKQVATKVEDVLNAVDLKSKAKSLVSKLSGGQKQRVSLAIALIGTPKVLVLDEPTVGLDPVLRDRLWKLFTFLARRGTTLIISSHSMDEAERCDDLVLLREGRVIAHSSPKLLKERTRSSSIEQSFLKLVKER